MRKRSKQPSNRMWDEGQSCQRFFEYRQWQQYFAVTQTSKGQEQEGNEATDAEARVRQLLEESRAKTEDARERQAVDGSFKRYVADPWLEFTGWHRHLQEFQWDDLLRFVEPTARERKQGREGSKGIVR